MIALTYPRRPDQYIAYGLVAASLLLVVCIMLRPAGLSANDGISYFGGFINTVVPYSLALILYSFVLWRSSDTLPVGIGRAALLRVALRAMAVLMIGLVVTPHTLVNPIHTTIGATLFSLQLLLAVAFVSSARGVQSYMLVGVQLLSGLAALYYLPLRYGLLLQSQIVFQLAFGLVLIRLLKAVK